jgi:hypothetical protein
MALSALCRRPRLRLEHTNENCKSQLCSRYPPYLYTKYPHTRLAHPLHLNITGG